MPKNVLRGLSVIVGVLFLFGCTGTKNVSIQRYIEVKDRVDQNMEEGNAGFLSGTPQPEDRSGIRKTRKTYVVEVSKEAVEETEEVVIESGDALMEESAYDEEDVSYDLKDEDYDSAGFAATEDNLGVSYEEANISEDMGETVKPASSFVEYTVQKDDTMQKISKKFYDSYSKWPKIYEVNKDVISNPDRIKPGIVLQIPTE
ncbi:MAG: LysM peptidoglycan-binding domain-containing protein [Candidatus Omnitrophica bacterium]|nr:LysM peptidoglycan-binding domain-containing protein [Candidatus Omnitrophota bacterium]